MTRILLALSIGLGVVLFGGTPHWVRVVLIGLAVILALRAAYVQWGEDGVGLTRSERVSGILFLAVLGWAVVGTMGGSALLFGWLGQDGVAPAVRLAQALYVENHTMLALSPVRAMEQVMWLAALGLFAAAALFASRRIESLGEHLFWIMQAVIAGAALYGIAMISTGAQTVLWHGKLAYQDDLTGTFINPNHFSTLLVIGFVGALGLIIADARKRKSVGRLRSAGFKNGSRLKSLLEEAPLRLTGIGLCLLYGGAIYLTGSQGGAGTLGLAVGLTVAIIFLQQGRMFLGLAALGGTIIIGWIGYELLFGARDISAFGLEMRSLQSRTALFTITTDVIKTQPFLGTGLGSFQDVFRQAKPDWLMVAVDYAHNTYLELALELGIPMTLVLVSVPVILMGRLIKYGHHNNDHEQIFKPLNSMAIGATIAVGLHATVDFSIQIPGVAVVWLIALGAASGQAQPHAGARS